MTNIVTVNVLGSAGTGKTTIAKIINDALTMHNIPVITMLLDGNSVDDYYLNEEHLEQRIKSVSTKTQVVVKEVQLPRANES